MAGVYSNLIKELIAQTNINGQLLNDINNLFDKMDKKNLHDNVISIYEKHQDRVCAEYKNIGADPIYKYFDGTNLLNSFLSTIIIPFEFLKSRKFYFNNLFKDFDSCAFKDCQHIISNLFQNNNLLFTDRKLREFNNTWSIYNFFRNLRDAIAHAGNGQIFFGSNDTININYIYFYNEDRHKITGDIINLFFVKMDLQNELFPLLSAFNKIITAIDNTDTHYTFEVVNDFVKKKTGKTLQ